MVSISFAKLEMLDEKFFNYWFGLKFAYGMWLLNKAQRAKQKLRTFMVIGYHGPDYPGLGMAPERFSNEAEEMTQANKVTVYGAGEFVPAMESLMRFPQAQWKWAMVALITGRQSSSCTVFAGVPFGFTADEINAWVNRGGGLELWEELYKPFNEASAWRQYRHPNAWLV